MFCPERSAVGKVLRAPKPSHVQRVWMVYYLQNAGYAMCEVIDLIAEHNRWCDYDPCITSRQVASLFHAPAPRNENPSKDAAKPVAPRPPSLGEPHDAFFAGAREYACEHEPGLWSWRFITWEPERVAIYRTVNGIDHKLLVFDLDGPTIEGAWVASRALAQAVQFTDVKFSSRKGFHNVLRVPEPVTWPEVKQLADDILDVAGIRAREAPGDREHRRVTLDLDGASTFMDCRLFHDRQLIRGYTRNMKSGLRSVPVLPADSLQDVLRRAAS